jgi:drug/metabolite transporter (DMT)-like permease
MNRIVRRLDPERQINRHTGRSMLPRRSHLPASLRSLPEDLPVTIRRALPGDRQAIIELAEVDEASVPEGRLILAVVAGELWAAASLDDDQGISDPFRPSGELLRALDERAGRRPRPAPEHRKGRLPGRPARPTVGHDSRAHPPLVRVRASADPAAQRDIRVGCEQDDAAVVVECPEHEHLGAQRADLPGREVDDRDDESPVEIGLGVVDDLRRRATGADLGAEVDRQLPGRLAGLGELVDRDHPADPHVDPGEVIEGDHGRANITAPSEPAVRAGAAAPREPATPSEPAVRAGAAAPWLAWLALITVYIVWGSTYLAIRVMVRTVPPLLGAGARFVCAGLALYAWVWLRRAAGGGRRAGRSAGASPISRREAAGAACVGILLSFGGNGLVTVAERHIASSLAALVIASEPFVVVLIGAAIGVRVSRAALVGVTVGFAGVTILVLPSASAGGNGLLGVLLVLAAAVSWALGSVASTRVRMPADLGLSTALQMTAGGVAMVIAAVLTGEAGQVDVERFSAGSVAAFAYLVVFGSIVAYTAYSWLLQNVSISRVSTYAYVNPMIAVVLGWSVLGEAISPTMLVGASVIVGSVAFTIRSTRPEGAPAGRGAPDRSMVATARRRV